MEQQSINTGDTIGSWIISGHIQRRDRVYSVYPDQGSPDDIFILKTRGAGSRRKRFFREVRLVAELDHPNIIKMVDYDLSSDIPYMVTEYYPGGDINHPSRTDFTGWSIDEKIRCFQQICDAMGYICRKGYMVEPEVFLKKDRRTPVLGDLEHVTPIQSAEDYAAMMEEAGQWLWSILEEKKYSRVVASAHDIDHGIEILQGQITELQQRKAELLD